MVALVVLLGLVLVLLPLVLLPLGLLLLGLLGLLRAPAQEADLAVAVAEAEAVVPENPLAPLIAQAAVIVAAASQP